MGQIREMRDGISLHIKLLEARADGIQVGIELLKELCEQRDAEREGCVQIMRQLGYDARQALSDRAG